MCFLRVTVWLFLRAILIYLFIVFLASSPVLYSRVVSWQSNESCWCLLYGRHGVRRAWASELDLDLNCSSTVFTKWGQFHFACRVYMKIELMHIKDQAQQRILIIVITSTLQTEISMWTRVCRLAYSQGQLQFAYWLMSHHSVPSPDSPQVQFSTFKILFYFSIKVDVQYHICFRYKAQWLDINIIYEVILSISLVLTCHHTQFLQYY